MFNFSNEIQVLENGWICHIPSFFSKKLSDYYIKSLLKECVFKTNIIRIFGKEINTPRQESFHSVSSKKYSYSGNQLSPQSYNETLLKIQTSIVRFSNYPFNSVLVNLYRNEKDSNGWHADNEKELGQNPVIASVSFGQSRRFQLQHRNGAHNLNFILNHGDLFMMGGQLQHYWKHQVPKEKYACKARINLTYRYIF